MKTAPEVRLVLCTREGVNFCVNVPETETILMLLAQRRVLLVVPLCQESYQASYRLRSPVNGRLLVFNFRKYKLSLSLARILHVSSHRKGLLFCFSVKCSTTLCGCSFL